METYKNYEELSSLLGTEVELYMDSISFEYKPKDCVPAIKGRQKASPSSKVSMMELLDGIEDGKTICPAVLEGGVSDCNFKSQQLFMVDVDNKGAIITPDEALEICKIHGITPAFIYASFSSTLDVPKYRVGFLCDHAITDRMERDKIQKTLIDLFPTADKACTNGDRLFFGSFKDSVWFVDDTRITLEDINRIATKLQIEISKAESISVNRTYTVPCKSNDLSELQKVFPFEEYLADLFSDDYDKTTHKMHVCPICGGHDDFSYDPKTNRITCFSDNGDCGKSRSVIDFIMVMDGLNLRQAIAKFYKLCGKNSDPIVTDNTEVVTITNEE